MAAIPRARGGGRRRPSRERETLVGERTRIINRVKATLVNLGICNFKPNLRTATERLEALRTPEGVWVSNTLAELHRDMARLQLVKEQIREIEQMRLTRLAQPPVDAPRPCSLCWRRSSASGIETADMLVHGCSCAIRVTDGQWHGMPASPAHRTRAAPNGARKGSVAPAMRGCPAECCSWRGGF
jgi:transposase